MSQALLPSKHAQWFAVLHKHWFLEADVKTSPGHDSKPRAWIGDNAVELPPSRAPARQGPCAPPKKGTRYTVTLKDSRDEIQLV